MTRRWGVFGCDSSRIIENDLDWIEEVEMTKYGGIFEPMFNNLDEADRMVTAANEARGTNTHWTAVEEENERLRREAKKEARRKASMLLVERFVYELPEAKAWATAKAREAAKRGIDKTVHGAVAIAALVADKMYEDRMRKREIASRLGAPSSGDTARDAVDDVAKHLWRTVRPAIAWARGKVG